MKAHKDDKSVAKVTIEYADGSKAQMETYAAVGFAGDTWHSVLLSPAGEAAKIKMNNLLVELSDTLIKAINEQK
jgi:hypothetical protein